MREPANISLRALLEHAHFGIVIHRWDEPPRVSWRPVGLSQAATVAA